MQVTGFVEHCVDRETNRVFGLRVDGFFFIPVPRWLSDTVPPEGLARVYVVPVANKAESARRYPFRFAGYASDKFSDGGVQ